MKENGFGLILDRCYEKRNVFNDVRENGFKCFSGVNWSVGSVSYWSVAGYSNKDGRWFLR